MTIHYEIYNPQCNCFLLIYFRSHPKQSQFAPIGRVLQNDNGYGCNKGMLQKDSKTEIQTKTSVTFIVCSIIVDMFYLSIIAVELL